MEMSEGATVPPAPESVWRILRLLRNFTSLLGIVVLVVSFTPAVFYWAGCLAKPWDNPKGDVLIVLSSSSDEDNQMSPGSYRRAVNAKRAYFAGGFHRVLVTGGGRPAAALAIRDYLVAEGVPAGEVTIETQSASTRENALFSKPLLQEMNGRKVLFTSDYHMYRAYRTFRKAGIDVSGSPFPDVRKRASTWGGRWPGFLDLSVETVKILYYYSRGWM